MKGRGGERERKERGRGGEGWGGERKGKERWRGRRGKERRERGCTFSVPKS